VDLQEVTEATEGFSGADLQALMYNAHLEVVNESITSSASSEDTVSTDKEIPIQYTTIGGQSKPLKSKAEEAALQRRVGDPPYLSMFFVDLTFFSCDKSKQQTSPE